MATSAECEKQQPPVVSISLNIPGLVQGRLGGVTHQGMKFIPQHLRSVTGAGHVEQIRLNRLRSLTQPQQGTMECSAEPCRNGLHGIQSGRAGILVSSPAAMVATPIILP